MQSPAALVSWRLPGRERAGAPRWPWGARSSVRSFTRTAQQVQRRSAVCHTSSQFARCLREVDMTTASSDESSLDSFGAQLEAEMLQEAEQEAAAAEHLDTGEAQPKRRRVDAEEHDAVVAAAIPPPGMSTSVRSHTLIESSSLTDAPALRSRGRSPAAMSASPRLPQRHLYPLRGRQTTRRRRRRAGRGRRSSGTRLALVRHTTTCASSALADTTHTHVLLTQHTVCRCVDSVICRLALKSAKRW
jgi:outer membrane murein-binding lipoprotein Lpp